MVNSRQKTRTKFFKNAEVREGILYQELQGLLKYVSLSQELNKKLSSAKYWPAPGKLMLSIFDNLHSG